MSKKKDLCIRDLLLEGEQKDDSPAIESPGYQPLTYRDMREQITYVVQSLNARGFQPNDRIAVIMPRSPETAVCIISVMAGFTLVPLNSQYKEQDFSWYFSHLGIKSILVQRGEDTAAIAVANQYNIPVFEVIPLRTKAGIFSLFPDADISNTETLYASPSDTAILFQTSGTTSEPKIVPVTQKRLFLGMQRIAGIAQMSSTDRSLHILPFDSSYGNANPLWCPLLSGGALICPRDFIASDFSNLLLTYRLTVFWGVPAHLQAILQDLRKKLPNDRLKDHSIRFLYTGGAVTSPEVHRGFKELLGIPVTEGYVMSEAFISMNLPYKEGSVGIPFVEQLAILDDTSHPLQPHESGEICVWGELVFSGYENNPAANAESFVDGWFHTGDIGYLDDEGYLFYVGRKKEMINKGGRKIAPWEIDHVLLSHPAVRDAMAFRIPDPVLGEDIAVMVVKAEAPISEEDLHQYCLDHLIPFKVPRRIVFVEEIPRNALGKPLREEGTQTIGVMKSIRQQPEKIPGEKNLLCLTKTEERLLQLWQDILELPDVSADDDFFLSGGNSLTAIELLVRIQREFHVNFPPDTIYRFPTIRQQVVLVAEKTRHLIQYHPLIVLIRTEGKLPPLFCVHPVDGWIGHYKDLAKFLSSDRPVYGIRAQGWEKTEIPFTSVKEAAREYIGAIKTVQKTGSYHLLGFSGGASHIYEIACQLRKNGDMVAFLGLVDQSVPAPEVQAFKTVTTMISPLKRPPKIPFIAYKGFKYIKNYRETHPDSRVYSTFIRLMRTFSKGITRISVQQNPKVAVPSFTFDPETEKFLASRFPPEQQPLVRTILKNILNYVPSDYSGDAILFSTGLDQVFFPGDPTRGWGLHVKGNMTVIDVPGNHNNLFHEENCRILAHKIEEILSRSDGLQ